jgi:energy-coupling factor transporter ATP-binding protein EcfA2
MRIERIQIEEGFLDGLDVELTSGLNVVMGERGTGKTSLIELVRFCLDVAGYTPESSKRSQEHALSVLGSGQVTITLVDGARRFTVSRTGSDAKPRAAGPYPVPIIFSQTEIESIGLHSAGRLRLLDGFVRARTRRDEEEASSVAEIKSRCVEALEVRRELQELERQLAEFPSVEARLAELVPRELALTRVSETAAKKKMELDALSDIIARRAVAVARTERLLHSLARWRAALNAAANLAPEAERSGEEGLESIWNDVQRIRQQSTKVIEEIGQAEAAAGELQRSATELKLADEGAARALRKEIEQLQGGAGAVTSAGQQLRERRAQLEAIRQLSVSKTAQLGTILSERSKALDRLDQIRDDRFLARQEAATTLSSTLGPRIRAGVRRRGQFELYASTLAEVLKGSGLRYGELSGHIAQRVSPRELVEAAEQHDIMSVAHSAEISKERAARLLTQVQSANLGELATVLVEDEVQLQLLDGTDYKNIAELSTGQRCTVVLPLVLGHKDRILIVDQPEDHIDNAFIVETLIRAISVRRESDQMIFSTHNANIPVLGNADRVIQLGSDGRRGFLVRAAELENADVVEAITAVMEGGAEAFNKRAEFYARNALV